jgi:hypothetical protein
MSAAMWGERDQAMTIQPSVPEHPTHDHVPRPVNDAGHPHGRPISWALVATVLIAFTVGGIALILHAWWLMAICGAIVLAAIPVGAAIRIMSDTVGWTGVMPSAFQRPHVIREASRLYEEEHGHPREQ